MMLTKPILLSRSQIDTQIWDNHIQHSRQCVMYALSWYLDIVCEEWQALVWPSAADFSLVMPLPVRRPFGIRVLHQPLFCQYLGIFSKEELLADQCAAFLETLAERFIYISSYAFNPENYAVLSGLIPNGFEKEVFQTHWLHLNRPYAGLYASYTKDRLANLKRGRRAGWRITGSDDFEPLVKLFEENHAPHVGKIKAYAYHTLRRLGERCIPNNNGCLMYAHKGTRVHAGIMLAHYRGRTIYLFNAADITGRKENARALMLDIYFRDNAGTELVFDFESPEKPSIAAYYAGFGATVMPCHRVQRNALPFPFRQMQMLRKWLLIRTRRYLF